MTDTTHNQPVQSREDTQPLDGVSIAFVIPHTPESVGYDSGAEFLSMATYHDNYCQAVSDLGADVDLIYLSDSPPPTWASDYTVRTVGVTAGSSFGSEVSLDLYRTLARTDADVVHVHGYNQLNALPILGVLATVDAAVVVQNHGSALEYESPKHRLWYTLLRPALAAAADKAVSVNAEELRNLERVGVPSETLAHIPNGVDLDLFQPLSTPSDDVGMSADGRDLLYVGRITENKGLRYLIRALDNLPADTRLHLVYSGVDDAERERVETCITDHGLDDRVRFVGEVAHEDLPRYYSAADVCVFPSVNEGFGVVTLEAMACGTPVIATTEHAAGGHLRHETNALVAEPRSASSLATHLERALTSPDRRRELGQAGLRTVREHYSWNRIGQRLADVYQSACECGSGRLDDERERDRAEATQNPVAPHS